MDQWIVSVPANKKLKLTLSSTKIDAGFNAYAEVFDASGTRVGGMYAGTETFTLPGAGVYVIQVRDAGSVKRGTYRLLAQFV
jgi:hypothetical protein